MTMSGGSHIEIDVLLGEWTSTHQNIGGQMAVLNCSAIDDPMKCPVVFLDETSVGSSLYHRSHILGYKIFEISPDSTEINMKEAKGVDKHLKGNSSRHSCFLHLARHLTTSTAHR